MTKSYDKIGNVVFHGYDTDKDEKKAVADVDRVLRLLSGLSVADVIKTLEPYRRQFSKGEQWSDTANNKQGGEQVNLPCKVGDTVYIVGNHDCALEHAEDEKTQRKIYLRCAKLAGDCDRCKYALPKMDKFVCTYIQISTAGVLVCGDKCQGFLADRIFTDKAQAEARLKELQEKYEKRTAQRTKKQ